MHCLEDEKTVQGDIDQERLRAEIESRLPLTKRKTKGRAAALKKSLLAVLLCEASSTGAHRSWGYPELGQFVAVHGVAGKTFAKYLRAGRNIHRLYPDLYREALRCLLSDRSPPYLPAISKLAGLPRSLTDQEIERGKLSLLLDYSGTPGTMVSFAVRAARYGSSDRLGRHAIDAIDRFLTDAPIAVEALDAVLRGEACVPTDQLGGRLSALKAAAEAALDAVSRLRADQVPEPTT